MQEKPNSRVAQGVHGADGLSVGIGAVVLGAGIIRDIGVPCGALLLRLRRPILWRRIAVQRRAQRLQPQPGIADDGEGSVFGRVVPGGVERDELRILGKGGPRTGGEIL